MGLLALESYVALFCVIPMPIKERDRESSSNLI